MEDHSSIHNLTCILFPGVVKNDEKALECLGGIRYISEVIFFFSLRCILVIRKT